jgi:hypothetical protein
MKTQQTNPAQPVDLPRLVRPFAASETAQWRRRAEILTALNNIHDLSDEARKRLDWRETRSETPTADLEVAAEALAELSKAVEVLWPNKV